MNKTEVKFELKTGQQIKLNISEYKELKKLMSEFNEDTTEEPISKITELSQVINSNRFNRS